VGCDTPNSATQIPNGIIWYDFRSNDVYLYQVGAAPQAIGGPIKNDILGAITNKNLVWGSFDRTNNTYFLTIPSETTAVTKTFVFDLDTQSWSYDERDSVYGTYPVDGGAGRLTYGQLTGTYAQIAAANANYGVLGATQETPASIFYGYDDGALGKEQDFDTMSEEFVWESKIFRSPVGDLMVSRLMLLYHPFRNGSLLLEYRRNGGAWVNYKTLTFNAVQGRTRGYITKLIRANEFQWRIRSSTGNFKLLEYRIEVSASPEDK
jgi:hypothetical protein